MTTRRVVAATLLFLMTLLLAGCTTSSAEWSGQMPNENGTHVRPYDVNQDEANAKTINPIIGVLMPSARLSALVVRFEIQLAERVGLQPAAKNGEAPQPTQTGYSAPAARGALGSIASAHGQ